jgi:hypothetical protein
LQTLELKYEGLIKEVRGLEGTLADYNLAQDKTRSGVDPSEILAYCESLHRRNIDEARAIDRIFLDRQDVEKGVGRLEEAAVAVQARERARLDSLPHGQRAEFSALLERNERSADAVDRARVSVAWCVAAMVVSALIAYAMAASVLMAYAMFISVGVGVAGLPSSLERARGGVRVCAARGRV